LDMVDSTMIQSGRSGSGISTQFRYYSYWYEYRVAGMVPGTL
jgi:hypothetical protein